MKASPRRAPIAKLTKRRIIRDKVFGLITIKKIPINETRLITRVEMIEDRKIGMT
jgi:hypothetical protein